MSHVLVSVTAASLAVYLHGCGGSDDPTTPSSSTSVTTTSTTLSPVTGLICNDGDESKCLQNLNSLYAGFDEENDASPLGVPMRGRPRFDDNGQWYFCTGECFQGQPDCYTPGGLINHKIMITDEGKLPNLQNSKSGTDAYFARYPVLIILQPETALTYLTKCAWQFDGSAFNRQNGGCGTGGPASCDDPLSAFNDKCPGDTSQWADESCEETMLAYCGNASVDYSTNCFWKGPAFNSPAYPGAQPDFDFSEFSSNDEIRRMMTNRVNHQSGTEDGHVLLEYWNEITMDGRILQHFEQTQGISSVVAAVAFVRGNDDAIDAQSQVSAQNFTDYFKKNNATIPLLVLDTNSAPGEGPFKSLNATALLV